MNIKQPAGQRAGADDAQRLAHDLRDDAPRGGAQREADADLGRAARHRVRHDRVDADRRQDEHQRSEHDEHARRNRAEEQVLVDVIA